MSGYIIRSNELIENGYEFFTDRRLLTIFTAPNYTGNFKNYGAIVSLHKSPMDQEIRCRIKVVKPIMKLRSKMTGQMTIEIEDSRVYLGAEVKDVEQEVS
ncbi:unnamed protein product [Protopolystoma xenopodis]|uniref:protein-serine/threonine phosphatase n=1 Tax=Protopolystoma xenopodis TaxID=117903 RepID=A0A3S5B300_9PLAT|nr:unnamed protein product [Protopolystoma xenopodis]